MDSLFGDLPPPSGTGASLFSDLPPESASNKNGQILGKRDSNDEQTTNENSKKVKLSPPRFKLKGYIGHRRGEREDMQDAHTIIDDFTSVFDSLPNSISRVAFYGVFDGHAGPRAATFAAEHLHKNIQAKLPKGDVLNLDREVKKCLIEAFKKTDEEFLVKASASSPSWKDGSTVASVLVLGDTIYSANLGDSKAVLCRRSSNSTSSSSDEKKQQQQLSFFHLTKDHNPSSFEERKRIEKLGGTVREGRIMGIVEVSRSIGDGRFKHCGVIATPDVLRCHLTENDLFILVACDGLWKVFTVEDAAKFVIQVLEDESIQLPEVVAADTNFESKKPTNIREVRFEEACNRLAVEAVKRGCTDNVTVMIVDIKEHGGGPVASEH